MVKYLTAEEVLRLHFQLIEDYGGLHGVRDEGRIQSAVTAPKQEVFGKQQYEGVYQKTAVYLRNIIADHPFVDGNKRTAVTVAVIFLARNNIKITASTKELEDFAVKVATKHLSVPEITKWFLDNSR